MLSKTIEQEIRKVVKNLGLSKVKFAVEHPENMDHGDFACNVAMVGWATKSFELRRSSELNNPKELAKKIVKQLNESNLKKIASEISIAGPGFINISIQKDVLGKQIDKLLKGHVESQYKGKKIAVEYTDPNPFKELHIGHLYSNFIGESVSKIFEANSAVVWRGDFYGDVGMHVAKSVWGMLKLMKREKVSLDYLKKQSIKQRQAFMGKGYALGSNEYEDSDQVKEEVKDLNYLVYIAGQEALKKSKNWKPIVDYWQYVKGQEGKLKEIQPVYEAGLNWSLEYFETFYKRLGTKFDGYYPESWVGELGMKVVEKGLKMKVLEKSKGAVVYKGEQDGLHTRVFVNKLGLPTYEAKDLGLVKAKYEDFKFDLSINVFGKEIDEYFKVVKKAMEKIEPELGKKQIHLAHGMVNLPEGKMSSRSGNVITVEGLLDKVKKQAMEVLSGSKVKVDKQDEVAEMVAQGAVRYAFLKTGIGQNIVFDINSSVSLDGNSGPYLQYTYARCQSVLSKGLLVPNQSMNYGVMSSEEDKLLRTLYRLEEVLAEAAEELAPNLVCNFLYDLAQKYNSFYNKHSILKADKEEQKQTRLWLTQVTGEILRQGLSVLGIKAPEKM